LGRMPGLRGQPVRAGRRVAIRRLDDRCSRIAIARERRHEPRLVVRGTGESGAHRTPAPASTRERPHGAAARL
jgi:hypothetical protein